MPCPKCDSHNLWDDNLAWGCSDCHWFTTGAVHNVGSQKDRFQDYVRPKRDRSEDAYKSPPPPLPEVLDKLPED